MRTRSPLLNAIADYMLSRHYSLRTVERNLWKEKLDWSLAYSAMRRSLL
jgi:hypothetical protein